MKRLYWKVRIVFIRRQLRKYPPRPSTDEMLRRMGLANRTTPTVDPTAQSDERERQ